MAAQKQIRTTLNKLFSDGERPTGEDFESAWMSFLNQTDDGLSISDPNNKNLVLFGGITLGSPNDGARGTLRFDNATGTVQLHDGTAFKPIADGGTGAFVPVGIGSDVAFTATGNVGIGTNFSAIVPPTHCLEISLGNNTGPGEQVLIGNLIIHNGSTTPGAYIGNNTFLASNPTGFALLQDSSGKTTINASSNSNESLTLALDGVKKIVINQFGAITVGGDMTIGTSSSPHNLTVNGNGSKPGGGSWADSLSDIRVKRNVRPFKEGLKKLLAFNPVIYNFNGKGGSIDNNKDYIGLIAQDVQKIMPELTISKSLKLNKEDSSETEILTHDLSPLIFMFINTIKELNARVEKLEKSKNNEKRKTVNSPGVDH